MGFGSDIRMSSHRQLLLPEHRVSQGSAVRISSFSDNVLRKHLESHSAKIEHGAHIPESLPRFRC